MKLNNVKLDLGGGSLLQIANRTYIQMMSYLIDTPDGKTIMIDGGHHCAEDAEHMYNLLKERGGKVDLWIITHAHDDHFGALLWLLENMDDFDLQIEKMCFTFPPTEWFKDIEDGLCYTALCDFLDELEKHNIPHEDLVGGTTLDCGGISIEVLNNCTNYKNYNSINDTTIVLLVHFPKRDVLFLGDLAVAGANDLITTYGKSKLRCDIVQMAHHGQQGVNRDFYEIVRPKFCLYTAPDWLWDNNSGNGINSGPWKTLETRKWMEELGAEQSFPCAFGDYLFE